MAARDKQRKVFVIYTGGTIGMVKNREGVLAPQKGTFEKLVRTYPQLHDTEYYKEHVGCPGFDSSLLVLPESKDVKSRIFYKIHEYDNLLDSANMSEQEWIQIANDIMLKYEEYEGFVVLHGTDTLVYTASALSFMFENIGKAVVVTGSQIPIFEPRSDGEDNFVSSLIIAGGLDVPEVTIFFGSKLFRANRTRKISAENMAAFDSPSFVPLVKVGVDIEVNRKAILRSTGPEKCRLQSRLSKNVALLRIFPTISSYVVKAFCSPPMEGVILESYGAGNMPTNRNDIFEELASAVKKGLIVVNITQCLHGLVAAPLYETGKIIADAGVIPGYDMTPEAALTKLSYVLSKTHLTREQKIKMMATDIRGEMTNTDVVKENQIQDHLNLKPPEDIHLNFEGLQTCCSEVNLGYGEMKMKGESMAASNKILLDPSPNRTSNEAGDK